ncbi:MAG: hypothetical protein PVSMB1_15280 [Gemmatimonadaceae bacterium]
MRAEEKSGSLLAAPYAVFLLVFAVYPILFALVLVFVQWDLVTAPSFAGMDNVRLLLHDGRFWRAVANTFVFLSIHVPLQVVTALTLALALNRQLAGRSFWRAAFFLPVVISGAVVATLWSDLYATDVGLINRLLVELGLSPVPWLTDPRTAMPAIAVMVTWKNVGFYVIIYLAGLQYIPRSCQEAIEIEGASAWERFRYLTRSASRWRSSSVSSCSFSAESLVRPKRYETEPAPTRSALRWSHDRRRHLYLPLPVDGVEHFQASGRSRLARARPV